jgi:copper transport protein
MLLQHVGVVRSALVSKRSPSKLGVSIAGTLVGLVVMVWLAGPASAHNSFVRSDPADGALLTSAPSRIALTFVSAVVLDQLQVDFTDASGARSALTGFAHAPSGQTTVLVPVPTAATGAVSFRWKLVGSDGHTVTGRVGLTITPEQATTTTLAVVATEPSSPAPPPTAVVATVASAAADPVVPAPAAASDSAPSASRFGTMFRWLLRLAAFAGLVALTGSILTPALLLRNAWDLAIVRRVAAWGVGLIAASTALLLAVFYREVGTVKVLLNTSYGLALALRLIALPIVAVYLFTWFPEGETRRWIWSAGGLTILAATWSWSGHPRSLRWPVLGVPLDVVHLAAAAAWIGGLAFMGLLVMRTPISDEQVAAVKAFAPVASRSVGALVVTGVLQSLRIDRGPIALFTTTHGRLLIVKVVVLALMLYVANVNRTRVAKRFRAKQPSSGLRMMLQRAMVTEAAVGLAILAVTAILVVNSPPS